MSWDEIAEQEFKQLDTEEQASFEELRDMTN